VLAAARPRPSSLIEAPDIAQVDSEETSSNAPSDTVITNASQIRETEHVPRTTTDSRSAHRATDEMPSVRFTPSENEQQVDHGVDVLAMRIVR